MMPRLNRTSVGILVVLAMTIALLGIEQRAAAAGLDKKSTADAKKATQLYKQGSYEEAATIFVQLSVDNPGMPVFVRNLGACYYYLRRPEPALSNLHEYLHKKKDITPEDSAEVERWIAEMDQLRQRGSVPAAGPVPAALPAAPTAPPTTTPVPPETPPAHVEAPAAPTQSPAPLPPYQAPLAAPEPYTAPADAMPPTLSSTDAIALTPRRIESGKRETRRTLAWVLGGVGGAALIAGGVFTYLALTSFSDIEKKYDPGKEDRGKTYAALQFVGYGVGGAAIAAAVILLATGGDSHKSIAFAPALGPNVAGASLSGAF